MIDLNLVESIARNMCEEAGCDPDQQCTGIRQQTIEAFPNGYKLWEYRVHFYVIPILKKYLNV